jgi:hypothetical protein
MGTINMFGKFRIRRRDDHALRHSLWKMHVVGFF